MDHSNQTVLVTGAGGNLGRALAQLFARRGARLVLLERDGAHLRRVYGDDNERQLLLAADLLVQGQVDAAVRAAQERFGGIDVLCNIAGGFRMGPPVHETPDEDWDFLFGLNTRSVVHAVRAVVPGMIASGGGRIVSVAANSALKGVPGMAAYCASKDAVIRITEAMAAELKDKRINVNCVLPSVIDTPENRAAMPDADPGRWVSPDALAEVIAFLASEGARAINGAAIPVVGRG
ncbi:SDR family oxidoreductase [Noviherbaspirillum soli]|uniref:SDR family oxidoreductase n=1 Tax=Noviherbaspirillum soli TaxID=1064518 RepID=UPI00188B2E32|nr:SDR family NAD(P)-dependent oxidoreductase [Noviherbaspirillum soli]